MNMKAFKIPTLPAAAPPNLRRCEEILENYDFHYGHFVSLATIYDDDSSIWVIKLTHDLPKKTSPKLAKSVGCVPLSLWKSITSLYEEYFAHALFAGKNLS